MSHLTVFPAYVASGCLNRSIDCDDPNSVLLFALLSLAEPDGATPDQLAEYIPSLCPTVNWTTAELNANILAAFRRGLITTVLPGTYAVNAGMVRINPANRDYYCLCQLYTS